MSSKTSYRKITLRRAEQKDINKGGDEFKMDDVRNALIRLKEVSGEMIKHLTEKDRKDLNFIIRTVYKHQHDQVMYKKIYAVFVEIFGEFKDKPLKKVRREELIAYLVESIKDLQVQINNLKGEK